MSANYQDETIIKLLHFFVTKHGYEPLIVHGTNDELWLQNIDADFKIIRLVKHRIHNSQQYQFDQYKTKRVMNKMRFKTLTWDVKSLTIYFDIDEDVKINDDAQQTSIVLKEGELLTTSSLVKIYPDITDKVINFKGDLSNYILLTEEINQATMKKNKKLDDLFNKSNIPYVTFSLIVINVLVYLVLSFYPAIGLMLVNVPKEIIGFGYYRMITAAFLHANLIHLVVNMYALYVVGSSIEGYFGKGKYLLIYFLSALGSSLLSVVFLKGGYSLGASGAIFGLLGAYLYFAYQYRVYMSNVLKNQLIPIIVINFAIGLIPGIDMAGHVGGLVMGLLVSKAIGTDRQSFSEQIPDWLMVIGYILFMIFLIK